jgi:hypothetical protein
MERTFKIGDKIRLLNYNGWGDYKSHKDQIATIAEEQGTYGWNYQIKWEDGSFSGADKNNLILVEECDDLKYIINKVVSEIRGNNE